MPKKKMKDMEASKKMNAAKEEEKKAAAAKKRYVPYELIREIFVHLPYKSLTRLKTACKQWDSITDDNQFVDMYRHRTANYPSNFVIWAEAAPSCSLNPRLSFHVYSLCRDGYTYSKQTKPTPLPHRLMLPSSYGLVGLFCPVYRYTSLFNPMTEELITLPNFPERYICKIGAATATCNALGFGFEPRSMKYKFVQLVYDPVRGISRCHVLTVRRGAESCCWRAIDATLSCSLRLGKPLPLCADGVLYWETSNADPEGFMQIFTFDLCSERIDLISSPYKELYRSGLVVLQGKLFYAQTKLDRDGSVQLDMSVLQGRLGWSRLYRLEFGRYSISASDSLYFFPLCIRDGEVLLHDRWGALYSYKLMEKKLENYEIIGKDDGNLSDWLRQHATVVHAETLVVLD